MTDTLSVWTLYDHPRDYPEHYVARRWLIDGLEPIATDEVRTSKYLHELRDDMRELGLMRMGRFPHDDPKIIEVWL